MGEIISIGRLKTGEFPRGDGLSQILAMRAIYNTLSSLRSSNFAIAFQGYGSGPSGKAGRRGDADMLVGWSRIKNGLYVRSQGEEEVVQQKLFEESLEKMIKDIAQRFHVRVGARFVSLVDARDNTSDLADDGLYLHHVLTSPIEWRIGNPLQNLAKYAIDIEQPLSKWQEAQIIAIGLGYMALKAEYFAGAMQWLQTSDKNEFIFENWGEDIEIDELIEDSELLKLEVLRLALEFAKAAARKLMAVGVIDNMELISTDVTSKTDMYRQFQAMAMVIDKSGHYVEIMRF